MSFSMKDTNIIPWTLKLIPRPGGKEHAGLACAICSAAKQ